MHCARIMYYYTLLVPGPLLINLATMHKYGIRVFLITIINYIPSGKVS